MHKKLLGILIVLVIIAGLGFAYYKASHSVFEANQTLSDTEVKSLIQAVGRHMYLPDEEPLVATIADIDMLVATQPFYQGADNGDILFIYPSISKAILYDPEGDRLINVGPIILDESAEGATDEASILAPTDEQPVDGPVETQ